MGIKKYVISLTKDKVWKTYYNGETVYGKKTSIFEVENLIKGKEFLEGKKLNIGNNTYKMEIPKVYKWDEDDKSVLMEECVGDNLELMLREKSQREKAVNILHSVLKFMLDNNFYWKDFAPRNIIIGKDTIYLVDFERGVDFEKEDIKKFFIENVYEEYVAFLLPEERAIKKEKILEVQTEENTKISLEDIKSSRIRRIANKKQMGSEILYKQYMEILNMILKAEEPRKDVKGEIIYPIVELEEILKEQGYDRYIDEIFRRNNIEREGERDV